LARLDCANADGASAAKSIAETSVMPVNFDVMVLLTGLEGWRTCARARGSAGLLYQPDLPANFDFRRATTLAGTKDDTSPPMEEIWRTSVAVIGRTAGD